MEVVGAACGLVPCLWPSLARRINYVKNLKKNFTKLEKDVEALCNIKNDIVLEIASDTSKIISKECQGWTEEVEKIVTKVNEIKVEVDENRRCLNGCCFPDICARKKLGERIVTMLGEVEEHKKEADFKGPKYADAPPAVVENVPLPLIRRGETAIDRCLQRIMQSIREAEIHKIGLWGMGGVGKTTALKSLNNHSEISQTFEVVIWATVSKGGSVRKLQKDIAQRLQMDIQESEADERIACKLLEKLKTKKYLLLLDDLWSGMDLDDVGIPIQEGSKVVLTTRYLNVCRNMETNDDIKVECMSPEEAWMLFHEKAGLVVDSPSIEPIAKDVVEECAGLPLAVVVIGRSLRGVEDVYVWQDALNQLKSATPESGDTEAWLFERLKWSYDRLKDVEQKCFLYCALYPEDYKIPVDELLRLWGPEGFTFRGGMEDSLDNAEARGHTIVNNLVDASMLERTEYGVKMHDVLRDLALWITSSEFLVRAGLEIEECPDDEKKWEEARRISLMKNKLSGGGGLPTNPRCNNELSTLLLQENFDLEYIPDMFFQHMHSLRVLDLSKTKIKVLPASVSNLVNLRGLYIWNYGYPLPVDLPREIGGLKKLEVFQVSVGSLLPLEVRQLTSLRRLWVMFHTVEGQFNKEEGMRTICSNGVISSLFLLEDLRIILGNDELRKEWCKVVDDSRVVAEEVGRLKRLTRLQFDFSRIECFEQFLLEQQRNNANSCLKYFHLSMSSESDGRLGRRLLHSGMENFQRLEEYRVEKCAAMETIVEESNGGPSTSTTNVTTVLQNLKKLWLWELPNLRSICEDPRHRFTKLTELYISVCPKLSPCVFTQGMIQHMPNLEVLDVFRCSGIKEIVMREDVETNHHLSQLFFPKLRKLRLWDCPKLVRIWKGASQPWPSIEKIIIKDCPKLSYVFTQGDMIQHMPNLEILNVQNCQGIEEIVKREDVETNHHLSQLLIFFPKLRELELWECPKLVRIWKGASQPWPSIQVITVLNCPNLENLNLNAVDDKNPPAALRKIKGNKKWWEALKWEDEKSKHRLQPLFNYLA